MEPAAAHGLVNFKEESRFDDDMATGLLVSGKSWNKFMGWHVLGVLGAVEAGAVRRNLKNGRTLEPICPRNN